MDGTSTTREGYQSPDIVGCQFSIYPLRQPDLDGSIRGAIQAAADQGCRVRVQNLSTLLSGSEDEVLAGLRAAFRAAQERGPMVMVATLVAGMPTDELVGKIQQELDAGT
ncbi:MAG: YkoF family thiamine/hydroxymethylpyrimidine-binding protein [Thermoleophilia bacterium]